MDFMKQEEELVGKDDCNSRKALGFEKNTSCSLFFLISFNGKHPFLRLMTMHIDHILKPQNSHLIYAPALWGLGRNAHLA